MTEQPQPGHELERTQAPDMSRGALHAVSLDQRIRYARELAHAGDMLPRALLNNRNEVNAGKLLLLVETGQMLGIHPVAAINGINVIEGKPTISPALMTALVRRAGHKLRTDLSGKFEDGTLTATCTIIRSDDPGHPFTRSWDMKRAERAGLGTITVDQSGQVVRFHSRTQHGKPTPWEKFTEAMLTARATGECSRAAAEEALCGVHYTAEELGGDVNDDGELISGSIVAPDPQASQQAAMRPTPAEQAQTNATVQQQRPAPELDVEAVRDAILSATSREVLYDSLEQLGLAHPPEAGRPKWGFEGDVMRAALTANVAGEPCSLWELFVTVGPKLPEVDPSPAGEGYDDDNVEDADVVDETAGDLPTDSDTVDDHTRTDVAAAAALAGVRTQGPAERVRPEDRPMDTDPWATSGPAMVPPSYDDVDDGGADPERDGDRCPEGSCVAPETHTDHAAWIAEGGPAKLARERAARGSSRARRSSTSSES